jgi:hypothetical protein
MPDHWCLYHILLDSNEYCLMPRNMSLKKQKYFWTIVSPITISGNIAFWDFCPPKIRKYNRHFAYSRLESKIKHFYTFFYRSYFSYVRQNGSCFIQYVSSSLDLMYIFNVPKIIHFPLMLQKCPFSCRAQ